MYCKNYLPTVLIVALMTISHSSVSQGRFLYRYVNEKGVKVLTYNIPDQYISNGYEVVDANGKVIQIVPPELSPEAKAEAELKQAEMERIKNWDHQLLKRYSRVSDIEAAKNRKLAETRTNINILRGNMTNLNNEIDQLQSRAAAMERRGQPVSEIILNNISDIREELKATANRIEVRQKEYQALADRFDKDIARFHIIKPEIIPEENENTVEKDMVEKESDRNINP